MRVSGLRLSAIAVASACTFAMAAPAGAQLLEHKDISASIALTIVQTAIETCKANDLFWSFRSPYSCLLTPRLIGLERDYDVTARVRPVYPIAVRIDGFFKTIPPQWWSYLRRDVVRTADMLGMPFAFPKPDPIVMNRSSGEVAKVQPHIARLTRLGVAAAERGKGLALLREVSATIFGGTTNWHRGDHLAKAVVRAGLDLAELDEDIARRVDHYEKVIAKNEAAQTRAGHWGVPLLAFKNEPFFGQDRFETFKWRLENSGLRRRRR